MAPEADSETTHAPGLQERLFATLVDIADDAVVVVDEHSTIQLFNQGAERIFGYRSAEVVGRPLATLLPPGALATHAAHMARFARSGRTARPMGDRGGITGRRADGSIFPAEASIAQVISEGTRYFAAILRDISAREQSERALAASEARFRALAEASPAGIFQTDADGRFLYVNGRWCELAGLAAADAMGDGWQRAVHPEDRAAVFHAWQAAIATGVPFAAEFRFLRPDGRATWVLGNAIAGVANPGGAVGRVGTVTDITERRLQAAALEQAKRDAESAAAAKGLFLANMSHEIRTPLNAVIGMTSLLLATTMSSEQKDMAQTIRASGASLLHIINDILDYSKAEAGKLELERQSFPLRDVVEEALDQVVADAAAKGLNLAYFIEDGVPPAVIGDAIRLRQILANLLANAAKFTTRGDVTIGVDAEPLGRGVHRVHFCVRDTGIGIQRERMAHLFQSFSQGDPSTTRKYGGTGLGLAISKRLAELMGGTAWAESEFGAGSTFHFTIACEADANARPPPPHPALEQLAGLRMLVVADNTANRRILVKYALLWGMTPVAHASASEALDMLHRGHGYDVAILDVGLHDPDAAALAWEMRRVADAGARPTLVLTAMGERAGAVLPPPAGAIRVMKPIKPAALLDALAVALGATSSASAAASPPLPAEGTTPRQRALRVLVAEDNPVNQQVALRMLAHLGHRADVAATGRAVLEALDRQPYDVVLMDVQMPELDGIEATQRIRRRAGAQRGPRIVAMTANAFPEHRELCLAAGMDAYLAKPIELDELAQALVETPAERLRAASRPSLDPLRLDHLRALAEADSEDFVSELIELFVADAPKKIGELNAAWASGDAARVRDVAHRLRSGVGNLGAARLEALCEAVERIDDGQLRAEGAALLEGIEREFAIVRVMLDEERGRRA